VRSWPALLLTLAAAPGMAATAYVTDELILGVFSDQNGQGQRLATLHSGAALETLGVNGDFTEVRLSDGASGWVKTAYLTTQEPATLRVKRLEEELDRSRATTPAQAEGAARNEVLQLKQVLADKQTELDALKSAGGRASSTGTVVASIAPQGLAMGAAPAWSLAAACALALACGFWLGYAMLAPHPPEVRRPAGLLT
jgi:hypothetical protein